MNADVSRKTYLKNLKKLIAILKQMRFVTVSKGFDQTINDFLTYYSGLDEGSIESCRDGYLYYCTKDNKSFQFELRTMDYKILSPDSVVLFDRENSGDIIHFKK